MLDIGWSELAVIVVVALVVIGPKDLPRALHTAAKWVRKARLLAREFQNSVDDMVRQAELEDLRNQLEQARSGNLTAQIEKAVDPDGAVRESLTVPNPLADTPKPAGPEASTGTPAAPAAVPETPAVPALTTEPMPPGTPSAPGTPAPVDLSQPETRG
ncbi:Sec-independent protein translocase protein TatB [Oleisolibacter albus]|uniref:Sec-independent protein translocase protein TatB n=1 Tax=Oleisolibacter albus TaxID=2171757 RepID=UPI000DF40749|nr:Sec-independent protein translocase protein TatB [Oleisolibacter albus]